jgi:hypothetical protein
MPQLPSSIHVAVDLAPLSELFDTWQLDASREQLDALRTIEDLYPFTRILELVPAQVEDTTFLLAKNSPAPPDQMAIRDTGFRLSECPMGLDAWTTEDKGAFQAYVNTRVKEFLSSQLEIAKKHYVDLNRTFVQKLEAGWMQAGVHPSQEPGWDDWPDNPHIDVFDQLVALLQCRDAIAAAAQGAAPAGNAVDRLVGFLSMAEGAIPWLPKAGLPALPTAEMARAVRETAEPGAFDDDKRDWWAMQTSIECHNLFNDSALEPFLMVNAPKAYGVIRLSAISKPDGTQS